MELIIGFIILLLAIIIAGYFAKKNYYKGVDRLELWKNELMNHPVLDEMAKVKQLNMTGQTEELFERWRNEWDDLVTAKLPDLEDLLFDTEEYIDKYRLFKAKEVQRLIEKNLIEAEGQIKKILQELNQLVGSEEQNRNEMNNLKDLYREAKKNLLAHRHSFGNAEKCLEKQLEEVIQRFQEFDHKTENGNYLEARETVLIIKNDIEMIKKNMDLIPQLLIECQSILPSKLSDVREGFREMGQQGYYLEHIQLENEIAGFEEELQNQLHLIEKLEVEKAEKGIEEMKEKIEVFFDLLEKEVHAKHFVLQNNQLTQTLLEKVQDGNDLLHNEVVQVLQSYHLTENDLENERLLDKEFSNIYKRYHILLENVKMNEIAQTEMSQELSEIKEQLEEISEGQNQFLTKLQALRKDELEAREKIQELTKKMGEMVRIVSKSNIPGLPESYKYLYEDGKESIENLKAQLVQRPLVITSVNQYLEIAVLTVEKLIHTTKTIIENAELAEKVIQYGNRYRRKYSTVSKALTEAEKSFRNFEYEKALEQAAISIEEIDPTAIKKIEALLSSEN
ncbi:MAG: septation ring formation regulator EzrA [Bacillota bacterium]|nr:septation ring formation regulator EzrA [Bacillota bacterium]